MTFQQSLDLAELEAELAHERFLSAFETDEHPEIVEQLNIEAILAQQRYEESVKSDPAH
ncbi:hypothetical protein [Ahrensia marina]|uniref:hypothetical protein n=1 Tax=Ahrensia marina TaxID=1514904 RepID=UPI000A95854F|nr:hypothetical protein [Ahrensia marina]